MKRTAIQLSLVALLAGATPAFAKHKTLYYKGKTAHGNAISFALHGKRMFQIRGYVTATCVPTRGIPRARTGQFHPPGSFTLGRTRKVSHTEYVSWWGNTTFNYAVSLRKRRGRVWLAQLHVNYSYVQFGLLGGGEVDRVLFVCQGDDSFTFAV